MWNFSKAVHNESPEEGRKNLFPVDKDYRAFLSLLKARFVQLGWKCSVVIRNFCCT